MFQEFHHLGHDLGLNRPRNRPPMEFALRGIGVDRPGDKISEGDRRQRTLCGHDLNDAQPLTTQGVRVFRSARSKPHAKTSHNSITFIGDGENLA